MYSKIDNKLIDIYFNNIYDNYRISENIYLKRILIKAINSEFKEDNLLLETDNIIKIFYLFLEFVKKNENINPDNIFNNFYTDNREIMRNYKTGESKKDFYDKLYLKEYLINARPDRFLVRNSKGKIQPLIYKYVSDEDIQYGVELRNKNYENVTSRYGGQCIVPSSLQVYQRSALKVMLDKIKSNISGEPKGLLMWYGTGSGKTFAASTIAKMVGFCTVPKYNFIKNIIIFLQYPRL